VVENVIWTTNNQLIGC